MLWTVVVPVKPATVGKSRLGRGEAVVRAIALDTIAAALETPDTRVVVVTADTEVAREAELLGARVVIETEPAGLDAAIAAGLGGGVLDDRAVLLGDLPALRPADLGAALGVAAAHRNAFVPDAEGTGSTLVTALSGSAFVHCFGPDSARHHREAGLVELELPVTSTLRRDVDLAEHLDQAEVTGLGPRTRAALTG